MLKKTRHSGKMFSHSNGLAVAVASAHPIHQLINDLINHKINHSITLSAFDILHFFCKAPLQCKLNIK